MSVGSFMAKKPGVQKISQQKKQNNEHQKQLHSSSGSHFEVMRVQPAGNQALSKRISEFNTSLADTTASERGKQTLRKMSSPAFPSSSIENKIKYQLSDSTVDEMRKDIKIIIREIQARFPDRRLILSLLNIWEAKDRELSSRMGTPHLDRIFELIEATKIDKSTWRTIWQPIEMNALNTLMHVMEGTTIGNMFRQLLSRTAYRDYWVTPEISAIWQWEVKLATEIYSDIEKGYYDSAAKKLKDTHITDRDDVAVALMAQISPLVLLKVAKSEQGNALLTLLLDELSAGDYEADERNQVDRISKAKTDAYITKNTNLEQDFYKSIKIFPQRKTGITVGSTAQLSAWQSRPGYVRVKMAAIVYNSKEKEYGEEVNSLGIEVFFGKGLEIPENEPVLVKDYDEGGKLISMPAFKLIEISNQNTTQTFSKIGEVAGYAVAASTLMFGVAAGAGAEAFTLGEKMHKYLRIADSLLSALSTTTSILLEHRGYLISEFKYGKLLVESLERFDRAVAIYGFVRVATQMPRLVSDLKGSIQNWRQETQEREKLLNLAGIQKIEKTDESFRNLEKGIENTQAIGNDGRKLGVGGDQASVPTQSEAFELKPNMPADTEAVVAPPIRKQDMPSGIPEPEVISKLEELRRGNHSQSELRATLAPLSESAIANTAPGDLQLGSKKPIPSQRPPNRPTEGQLGVDVAKAEEKIVKKRPVVRKRKEEEDVDWYKRPENKKAIEEWEKHGRKGSKPAPSTDAVFSKGMLNAQEELSVAGQTLVSNANGKFALKQVHILGVESPNGKFIPMSKVIEAEGINIKNKGRIADVAETNFVVSTDKKLEANMVILGDYKSSDKLRFLNAFQLTSNEIENAAESFQNMIKTQVAKENAVLEMAKKQGGVVLFRGTVAGTQEKVIFYAKPENVKTSLPIPYGGILNN